MMMLESDESVNDDGLSYVLMLPRNERSAL